MGYSRGSDLYLAMLDVCFCQSDIFLFTQALRNMATSGGEIKTFCALPAQRLSSRDHSNLSSVRPITVQGFIHRCSARSEGWGRTIASFFGAMRRRA